MIRISVNGKHRKRLIFYLKLIPYSIVVLTLVGHLYWLDVEVLSSLLRHIPAINMLALLAPLILPFCALMIVIHKPTVKENIFAIFIIVYTVAYTAWFIYMLPPEL